MDQLPTSSERIALYFGCLGRTGHYLHRRGSAVYPALSWTLEAHELEPTIPWTTGLMRRAFTFAALTCGQMLGSGPTPKYPLMTAKDVGFCGYGGRP